MKRNLVAAALTLAASGLAQAQTNGVTLYGIADADLRLDHTRIGTLKSIGSGGASGSRWGLRGTEDLGNGLKTVFTLEQGFDLSDNSSPQGNIAPTTPTSPNSSSGSRLFGRIATVGLNSATFGEIRFGRDYTPFYLTWASIDPFGAGFVAAGQNYAVGNVSRLDNSVYYTSPRLYGVQLSGAYRLGESTTNSTAAGAVKEGGNLFSIAVTYVNGPIFGSYANINTKNALDNNTTRAQLIGVAYDFQVVKLEAMVFRNRNDAQTVKQNAYAMGFTIPFGAWTFLGAAAHIDNRVDNGAANNNPKNDDANFFGAGVTYAFSKRTDLYAAGATQRNRGNAIFILADASNSGLFTTTGAAANVTPGFRPWSAQFGIRHRF